VLKDAVAYSIYGVRGANGVIVVTTKRGRTGKNKSCLRFLCWSPGIFKERTPHIERRKKNADLTWIAKKNSHDTLANGNPYDPLYGNGPKPILPGLSFCGKSSRYIIRRKPLCRRQPV
jgi:TonB-dependent SusC/RagA subfamily outer membrane receptor